MKSGYIYVLVHPSDPDLYKVGQTTLHPEKRLAQHNSNYEEYAGQIVKETGQKWKLKTFLEVPDPYHAEAAFWGATPMAGVPFQGGIEVQKMEWEWVQAGLEAAKIAGVRPAKKAIPDHVYAYDAWMKKRLTGRGITLLGHVRSKHGKSNFRCDNGHEWRTVPNHVADGEGCPQCELGHKSTDEMRQMVKPGVICLLLHPDRPGIVKVGVTHIPVIEWQENLWGDWEVHRYRNVDEPELAETILWQLLGKPQQNDQDPVEIELSVAEQAIRDLTYRLVEKIASAERGEVRS